MQERRFEYANLANLTFLEQLYSQYLEDPSSVDPSWQHFFEGMAFGGALKGPTAPSEESPDLRVFHLIEAYRMYGHKAAQFNPIVMNPIKPEDVEELKLENLCFTEAELSEPFPTCGFLLEETAPLGTLIEALQKTYCGTVGFEYSGMQAYGLERWLQEKIEPFFRFPFEKEEKMQILHALNKSEIMESFINMKYPGQKRFSLEGGETLIPILQGVINQGAEEGLGEIVFGMAHRGRLNVLANILGKSYSLIFHEFESTYIPDSFEGSGDVKYHKGYQADISTPSGKTVKMTLCDNPSHLESVDPVVEGRARAKQEINHRKNPQAIMPILIHGDSAVAGQGVVYETLQFSKLAGYKTGGTLHIVINNQVGFTARPSESQSTPYCTDIAKSFSAPIFHVNAEDPESCVAVAKLAVQIRQKFGCDIFIEMNCYRKYGHNEGDEPSFTQPLIYKMIREKANNRNLYRDFLVQEGSLSEQEAEVLENEFKESLNRALEETKELAKEKREVKIEPPKEASPLLKPVKTAVPLDRLKTLAEAFCKVPEGFNIHSKLRRIIDDRLKALEGDPKAPVIDWGLAENLAYATLLTEGVHVRLSGQDSGRGTFSHRHAILTDQETEQRYYPLSHLISDQETFDVYNSPLSEYAVMGFEYGYSLGYQNALVVWEAQFGDFANGAQVVIDQYISSSEQKWNSTCNLTLMLPHGYEGQGPEHSSARIERFLQLAGNDCMFVVIPTTPAQMFHLLRRQCLNELQKPLIIFSPKALLRYPPSLSAATELENGSFQEVIDDPNPGASVKRLMLCAGKVYYDLIEQREKNQVTDVAIVRIEQLYPFHQEKVQEILDKYKGFKECYWIQEEHHNMGAWDYIHPLIQKLLPEKQTLRYVGRLRSASPSAGSSALHKYELAKFLKEAFK